MSRREARPVPAHLAAAGLLALVTALAAGRAEVAGHAGARVGVQRTALLNRPLATAAPGPWLDVALGAPSYGGGAVADLDRDGLPEVVFGTYYHDERVLALHGDGSLLWQIPSGGGPVDGSVTVADLDRDGSPEVLWGNAATTVFHVADATGHDRWSRTVGEVLDAPAAIGDMDGDGRLDIVLASCGSATSAGGLRALSGTTGAVLWRAEKSACYQSAPLLFDQDNDGRLDVVVSTWFDQVVRAFSGRDGRLRWETAIGGWTYHAGAFGDLTGDGVPDVALGDYSGTLWALDGRTGGVLWSRALEGVRYVFGPTAMGDLDGDGMLEVVVASDNVQAYDADGGRRWKTALPGYATRGPALADVDGDGLPDVVVAASGPSVSVLSGLDGHLLSRTALAPAADFDFHPTLADLDGDGRLDFFGVYGRGQSDTPEQNWGRAIALTLAAGQPLAGSRSPRGGSAPLAGPGWPTYSHDHHHSGNFEYAAGEGVNAPTATSGATPSPGGTPTARSTRTVTATSSPPETPAGVALLPAIAR